MLDYHTTSNRAARRNRSASGLALLRQTSEMCDGHFHVRSAPGQGTSVTASMRLSHVDRPPLGDLQRTILALVRGQQTVDVQLHYRSDEQKFSIQLARAAANRKEQLMNLEELKKLKDKAQQQVALREGGKKYRVVVSMGTSGIAAGAREVMTTMLDEIDKRGLDDVEVARYRRDRPGGRRADDRVEEAGGEKTTYAQGERRQAPARSSPNTCKRATRSTSSPSAKSRKRSNPSMIRTHVLVCTGTGCRQFRLPRRPGRACVRIKEARARQTKFR